MQVANCMMKSRGIVSLGVGLLLAVLYSSPFEARAQEPVPSKRADTLRRELTVVADHILELPQSNKLKTQYKQLEPTLKPFSPNYVQRTFNYLPEAKASQLIHANKLAATVDRSGKNGYVNLGVGSLFNLRGDLGYRVLSTEKDQLGLFLSHRSTFATIKNYEDVGSSKAKDFATSLGANYQHRFETSTLSLNAKYQHRFFNYYGIALLPSIMPNLGVGTSAYQPSLQANAHTVSVGLGGNSNYNDADIWQHVWTLNYNFYRLDAKNRDLDRSIQAINEHHPELNLSLKKSIGSDKFLAMDFRVGGMFYQPDSTIYSEPSVKRDHNYYFAESAPSLLLDGGNGSIDWKLQLGVGLSVSHFESTSFRFFPKLDAALHFANTWKFYAKADGGLIDNGLRATMQEMPYLNPQILVSPSYTKLDARLGVGGSISEAVLIDLYARYRMFGDLAFFTGSNLDLSAMDPIREESQTFGNISFVPYYADATVWSVGAKLEYRYEDTISAAVEGVYNRWDAKEMTAAGKPKFELNARLNYSPMQALRLGVNYYLRSGVQYNAINSTMQTPYTLKDIHLLSAQADYRFGESLSFYVKAENLLNMRYELFPGYAGQGTSLMLGANFNF